jgi:DNA polymerase-3 subunit epsilon
MTNPQTAATAALLEAAAALLEGHPDYRVTRTLPSSDRLDLPEPIGKVRRALVIDTETTSLDCNNGKIIQIAVCPVDFDAKARIVAIGRTCSWTEDPGEPLSEEIVRLTGLTDADIAGTRIDDAAVARLIDDSVVIAAHNAGFDRAWWEARFPAARAKPWMCSLREIDWHEHGQDSRQLGVLLDRVGGWFNARHRADSDVEALVALLTCSLPPGHCAFAEMMFTAARPTRRITARGAPFAVKEALRARGYRWNARERAWQIEIAEAVLEAELTWLAIDAACPSPLIERVTWHERHR